MIQAKVPKYIDIEDKVIGPLTLKQFAYVGGAAAFGTLLKVLAPFPIFLIGSVILGSLAVALAFLRVNEQSFLRFLFAFFQYSMNPRKYLWGKTDQGVKFTTASPQRRAHISPAVQAKTATFTATKIRRLAEQLEMEEVTKQPDNQ